MALPTRARGAAGTPGHRGLAVSIMAVTYGLNRNGPAAAIQMMDGLSAIGARSRAAPKTLARLGGSLCDRLRQSWLQGLPPPGWLALCGDERLRSLPRVCQNAAEDAVRDGPSPVTARQPLT